MNVMFCKLLRRNISLNTIWRCSTYLMQKDLILHIEPQIGLQLDSNINFLESTCANFSLIHKQFVHTTANHLKKKGHKFDRKPVVYNKKSSKQDSIVSIWKNMTVYELATALNKTIDEVYEIFVFVDGSVAYDTPNSMIDNLKVIQDAVKIAGKKFVITNPKVVERKEEAEDAVSRPPPLESELQPRPPVVTIMGHVDHGKTTLLDTLQQSSIVDREFGGITQHIGAFEVSLSTGEQVTFLDTPGHAAFSAMRARGAHVTDLIVLVVAADDGVMQQTKECIEHAQQAQVPIIVAINKIDKADADVAECKSSLLKAGIQLEEQGGDVQAIEISALKGTNVAALIEAIVAQAEVSHIRADPTGLVEATIIESNMDLSRGKVATCIVHRGTLRKGSFLVAGETFAKVRNIFDNFGKPLTYVTPGKHSQVIGWRELPAAGTEVLEVISERRAKAVMEVRRRKRKEGEEEEEVKAIAAKREAHLVEYRKARDERRRLGFRRKMIKGRPPLEKEIVWDDTPQCCLVLKGDVDGTIEAILDVLDTYHSSDCPLHVLSYGVGAVTENDIKMAAAFKGVIYAFNTSVAPAIKTAANAMNVSIYEQNIIYRLIESLKDVISEKMPKKEVEEIVGEANVLKEFVVKEGKRRVSVAGCVCVSGTLKKEAKFKVIRDNDVMHEGNLSSMRHLKAEVKSIKKGVECGLMFDDISLTFEEGDTIVCFQKNWVSQQTDWNPTGF